MCLTVVAGRAVECAQALAEVSLYPVHIVRGGFQRFSALYSFLSTEKIMYTIMVRKTHTRPGGSYTHTFNIPDYDNSDKTLRDHYIGLTMSWTIE